MKKLKPILIVFGILLAIALFLYYRAHPLATQIEIRGHKFTVDLAVTNREKERGLGYRDSLAPDHGMLFVYDHPEQYTFWMKGMRFPLDMIWIENKTVVDISRNVPVSVNGTLPTYSPRLPVSQILEVNAGVADQLGIQIGDEVRILK